MKLPGIKYGADRIEGAFGRFDTNEPARTAAARMAKTNAIVGLGKAILNPLQDALKESQNRKDLMEVDESDAGLSRFRNELDVKYATDEVDARELTAQDVPGVNLTKVENGQTVSRGTVPTSEFFPKYRFDKVNQWIKDTATSIKNPRLRKEWFDEQTLKNDADFTRMTIAAAKVQKQQRKSRQIETLAELEDREDFSGQRELIANMEISAEEQSNLLNVVSQREETSAVTEVLLNGGDAEKAAAEKALRNSKEYKGSLTRAQRLSLARSLKANRQTSSVKADNSAINSIKGRIKEHDFGSDNGLDASEANAIADPQKRKQAQDMINAQLDSRQVADTLYAGETETAFKKLETLREKALDPGSPDRDIQAYNNAYNAVVRYQQEWEADPAATIIKHDKTAQAMLNNMPEDPQDQLIAKAEFRDYLRARQPDNPDLLTNGQAKGLADDITSMRGQDYAINLTAKKVEYGKDWNDVLRQLRDEGLISGVQGVMADMPLGATATTDLAIASSTQDEIWKTLNLPKGGGTDMDKAVQEELSGLGQTIRLSSEGDSTAYGDYRESVGLLAGLLLSQGRVATIEDGVKKAANEIILNQYYPIEETYRVAKIYPEGVKDKISYLLRNPSKLGVDPVGDLDLTLMDFKNGGYFVNNSTDTGVIPMTSDGIPLLKDGEILELSFDEISLITIGRTQGGKRGPRKPRGR